MGLYTYISMLISGTYWSCTHKGLWSNKINIFIINTDNIYCFLLTFNFAKKTIKWYEIIKKQWLRKPAKGWAKLFHVNEVGFGGVGGRGWRVVAQSFSLLGSRVSFLSVFLCYVPCGKWGTVGYWIPLVRSIGVWVRGGLHGFLRW